jgi:uncharacterized protein (DUF2267 family)
MSEETFWTAIRERWDPENEEQLRRVTHIVLHQLIHLVPNREALHVLSSLPVDITMLATKEDETIARGRREHAGGAEIESAFYDSVAEEAGVTFDTAREATRAVFHALKTHISTEEIEHIRSTLTGYLERAWVAV